MVDVDAQDTFNLPAAADEEPVEAVTSDGAAPAFGERVCLRRAERVRMISTPSLRKTSSEACVNLLSRSWIRKRAGVARSESDQATCRACWVVQPPSGLAEQPAKWTRRLLSSRKKSTWSRPSQSVSTVKKSQAMIESACARKKARQLSWARPPAGDTPDCRRIFATVVAETRTPTPASSPTIRL